MDALRAQDPARIGAYVVLARLGAGGMGQVYLGRSSGGRLVAVKVVREEITGHPEALARFRREAETVRAVRGAYTANPIYAGLDAAPYWIATEYVAGPTLADGEVRPAPPLAVDPGEWTVVYHHVTSDKNHRSVLCAGFMSETVSE